MKWSNVWVDWPDKPGFYWFYGYTDFLFQKKWGDKPRLIPMVVVQGANALIVHYQAEFIYRDTAKGLFLPLDEPDLPKLDGWTPTDTKETE